MTSSDKLVELQTEGEHVISETITLPRVSGGNFAGAGRGLYKRHGLQGEATHIVADKNFTGPMIDAPVNAFTIADFTLQGSYKPTVTTTEDKEHRPTAGIVFSNPRGAITGETLVDGVDAYGIDGPAFVFGTKLNDVQCDNTLMRGPANIRDVDSCVEVNALMAMCNVLDGYTINDVRKAIVWLNAGGHTVVRNCKIGFLYNDCPIFHAVPQRTEIIDGTKYTNFGAAYGGCLAENIKADKNCGIFLQYVVKENAVDITYPFRGMEINSVNYAKEGKWLAKMCNPGGIIIDGGTNSFQIGCLWAIHDPTKPPLHFTSFGGPSFFGVKEMKDVLHPESGPVRFCCDKSARAYGNAGKPVRGVYPIWSGRKIDEEYRILDGQGREYVENQDGTVRLKEAA